MTILSFDGAQLLTAFLVMVRTIALIATNPIFGHRSVPGRIRVIFGVLLGLILVPAVPTTPDLNFGMAEMAVRIFHETFIGISMGFLVSVLFSTITVAGHLISSNAGLQMATMFDPSLQTQLPVIGSVASTVAFLVLLATNLHHVIFRALAWSFTALPPGSGMGGSRAGFYLVKLFTVVLETALTISLPVLLIVFLINLAMAIIARLAPQMNVFFSIGGILNEQAAMLIVALSFPIFIALFMGLMSGLDQYLADIIRQFR